MNLAALGSIAGGINQGLEYAQRDKERKENQEFTKTQRQFLQDQQAQQKGQWQRDEQYGSDIKAVNAPVEEYVMPEVAPDVTGPQQPVKTTMRAPTQLEQKQRLLSAQAGARKHDEALKTQGEINRIFSDADRQSFDAFTRSAGSINDLGALGKRAAEMVSADSSPILVGEPTSSDGGKTWTANVRSRLNGATMPMTFGSKEELLKGLQYHMDYETYAATRKAELETAKKIAEKNAEPRVLGPGAKLVYPATGKSVTNDVGYINIGTEENPQLIPSKQALGGSVGSAGSSKSSGKSDDPLKPYADTFKVSATDGESKLTPEQIRVGMGFLPALSDQGIDPYVAARIAGDASTDPTKTRLEINHATGQIDRVYRNPDVNQGRAVVLARGAGSAKDLEKQLGDPEQVKAAVYGMLNSMTASMPSDKRAGAQTQLMQIAANPSLRQQYLDAASKAGKDVATISRQLDMIGTYGQPAQPSAAVQRGNASPSVKNPAIRTPGGIYQPAANPLAGKGRQQIREIKADLEKEKRRYLSTGQAVQADRRIKEIDDLLSRINDNRY